MNTEMMLSGPVATPARPLSQSAFGFSLSRFRAYWVRPKLSACLLSTPPLMAIIISLLLTGCQTAPINADTVNALPEGSALCSNATGIWGTVKIVVIRASQGIITNGGVDASADCTLALRNAPTEPMPRLAPLPTMPKPVAPRP